MKNAKKIAAKKEVRTTTADPKTVKPETPVTKEARTNVNVYTLSAKGGWARLLDRATEWVPQTS
jgi:hypothetical protein